MQTGQVEEVDIFKCCRCYLLQGIIVAIETVSKRLNQSAIFLVER